MARKLSDKKFSARTPFKGRKNQWWLKTFQAKEMMASGIELKAFCTVCLLIAIDSCTSATNSSELKYNGGSTNGFRAELVHVDSQLISTHNSTWLQRAVERSKQRLQRFTEKPKTKGLGATVNRGKGEFVMKLEIGTPGVAMAAIVDTGSDLTWTQCKPCSDCYASPHPFSILLCPPLTKSSPVLIPSAPTKLFPISPANPSAASTCTHMGISLPPLESFPLRLSLSVPPNRRARLQKCALHLGAAMTMKETDSTKQAELWGLGRGPLSFITQLGKSLAHKFSYCLSNSPAKSSTIFFGNSAQLTGRVAKSTPFQIDHRGDSSYFYLSLQGISVGKRLLGIRKGAFDVKSDGTGGFIIDSGTTITFLPELAYADLKKELNSMIKLATADGSEFGLDLCYKIRSVKASLAQFPELSFHFEGADFVLPPENYMMSADSSGKLLCLAMMPSDDGVSIFGNMQQQNYQILYDLGENMLSFSPALCDAI